ncbi:unnamed protein product, partial [Discosporangium mesarthrocarpum]
GLSHLDVFDSREDVELVAMASAADGQGAVVGMLSRPFPGLWSLVPMRVVISGEVTVSSITPRTGRSQQVEKGGGGGGAGEGRRVRAKGKGEARKKGRGTGRERGAWTNKGKGLPTTVSVGQKKG